MNWPRLPLTLRTWVLGWFLASLGVAVASPLVHPQSLQLVCSASGAVMLMVQADDGSVGAMGASGMDCPLCAPAGAPPAPETAVAEPPPPLAHALQPVEAEALMASTSRELGLPVADPMRGGAAFERLVESCLA